MRDPNRLLATGLVIASIGAPTPAFAASGGVSASGSSSGGLAAEGQHQASPEAQARYIRRHLRAGDEFWNRVLKAHNEDGVVEVMDGQDSDGPMVNPLVIVAGGRIVSYASRIGDELDIIPAGDADVTTQIGHHTFAVRHPEALVTPRLLHAATDTGVGPVGFVDADGRAFGVMP